MQQDRKLTRLEIDEVKELMRTGIGLIEAKRMVMQRTKERDVQESIDNIKEADGVEELRQVMIDFLVKYQDDLKTSYQ